MAIKFHYLTQAKLRDTGKLKQFMGAAVWDGFRLRLGNVNYVFCSDDYLLEINRSALAHDYYTDIITFDMGVPGSGTIDAEIYVSVDRVADNAVTYGVPYQRELHRVVFHGMLHLCGLKDKSAKDALAMRKAEDQWLEAYFS